MLTKGSEEKGKSLWSIENRRVWKVDASAAAPTKDSCLLGAGDQLDWGAAWGAPLPLSCWLVWQFSPRTCWFLPHQDPPSTRTSWTLSIFKRFCRLGFGKTSLNFVRGSMPLLNIIGNLFADNCKNYRGNTRNIYKQAECATLDGLRDFS